MLASLTFTIFISAIQKFAKPERIDQPKLMFYVGLGGLLVNVLGLFVLGGHGHSHGGDGGGHSHGDKNEAGHSHGDKKEIGHSHGDKKEIGHSHGDKKESNSNAITLESFNAHNNDEGHCNSVSLEVVSQEIGHGHSHESKDEGHCQSISLEAVPQEVGHDHAHSHNKKHNQMNMQAVFLHVLADFFGSLAVVASALVLWLVPAGTNDSWKLYVDPSISLIMVVLISSSIWPLFKASALILMQSVPEEVDVANLELELSAVNGVTAVHDFHVWRLHNAVIMASLHVVIDAGSADQCEEVVAALKSLLHRHQIHCTTIQTETKQLEDLAACSQPCPPASSCVAMKSCCPTPPERLQTPAGVVLQMGSVNNATSAEDDDNKL